MKYWITGLITLLIGSNAFWIFRLADNAVTDMYTDASSELTEQMYRQSLALSNLNLVGLTIEEAKIKIGTDINGGVLFEKEGCLYVGQICLQVSNNGTIKELREAYP